MTARILNLDDDERFVRKQQLEEPPSTEGFSGAISLPLLPDLIQIYTVSLADGALTLRRGQESGTIWFERGAIVHAACGSDTGEEAVYQLMRWNDGQFSHDTNSRAPMHTISRSWQEVLLESCQRLDEETSERFAYDSEAWADLDDAVFAIGATEEALRVIETELNGFIAAAVFASRDGALVAQRTREGAIDPAAAGPAVAEIVRQHSRMMAALVQAPSLVDLISSTSDELHLILPLPDEQLLYLAAARSHVNAALMRRVVDRALGRTA